MLVSGNNDIGTKAVHTYNIWCYFCNNPFVKTDLSKLFEENML